MVFEHFKDNRIIHQDEKVIHEEKEICNQPAANEVSGRGIKFVKK